MKAVLTFVRTYPVFLTGLVQGAIATAVVLDWIGPAGHYIHLRVDQLAGVQSFILFVLLGWAHQAVTPETKIPDGVTLLRRPWKAAA